MTHLTEKDLVTAGGVGVHRVYVIPGSDDGWGMGRRGKRVEEKRGDDERSDGSGRQSKIQQTMHPLLFSSTVYPHHHHPTYTPPQATNNI